MSMNQLQPGELFARRFLVTGVLGAGAYGEVYRARDQITQLDTAVKVLKPERLSASNARWREAAMLRRLDLPGVARLIAEGVEGDLPFLAMEYVKGRPFPRPSQPLPWEMIEGYVVDVLRVLALVHSSGLVHGDIKPGNVLIEDTGRLKLVDFGLSLSALANDFEGQRLHGTPVYMAPELFSGAKLSPQTDLFALGTMIFEALSGRQFFETNSMVEWIRLLKTKGPPTLAEVAPDADPTARTLVDALLAPNPVRRPGTAWEVLKMIEGTELHDESRWLGDASRVSAALAVIEQRSLQVTGPSGSGKTALVDEISRRERERGRRVHTLRAGQRPFESLARTSFVDLPAGLNESELRNEARRQVESALEEGALIAIARGAESLDEWTWDVVRDVAQTRPGIVWTGREPAPNSLKLERLTRAELKDLFAGPELALHLPSRAADVVWKRTLGYRADVFAELESWRRFNLAQLESNGTLRVNDRALSLLEQGLRTRAPISVSRLKPESLELLQWLDLFGGETTLENLASVLERSAADVLEILTPLQEVGAVREADETWFLIRVPPHSNTIGDRSKEQAIALVMRLGLIGSEQRFHLSLLGDQIASVYGAAVAASDEHAAAGRRHAAHSVLREAAYFLKRRDPDSPLFESLIGRWAKTIVKSVGALGIEELFWILADRQHDLRPLLEALRLANVSPNQQTFERLAAVPDTGDQTMERARRVAQVACLSHTGGDLASFTEEVREWGRQKGDADVEGLCLLWDAKILLRRKDAHRRAAELLAQAASMRTGPIERLNCLLNESGAWFEAFELENARVAAETILRESKGVGIPSYEVFASLTLLQVELRAGETPVPDVELAEVSSLLGLGMVESMARSTLAAAFERRGEVADAVEILEPALLRARPESGNSIDLMIATQMGYLQGRAPSREIIEMSRSTPHRTHLATVLLAAALRGPAHDSEELAREAMRLLSTREQSSFLYFIHPMEVLAQLGISAS